MKFVALNFTNCTQKIDLKKKFENFALKKNRNGITLRKNRTERKKINEISNRFLNKNRTLNSGLAPLRVLRIFGKLLVEPKFVYICDVPRTNAATAGQAGGTLYASFPNRTNSTFGFLPTHKAKVKKTKRAVFSQPENRTSKKYLYICFCK